MTTRDAMLTVSLGAPGTSFEARFELGSGAASADWRGSPVDHWVPVRRMVRRSLVLDPIEPAMLGRLRAVAEKMSERGPQEYRDQFAQATVRLVLVDGGREIAWTYDVDGGVPGEAGEVYDDAASLVHSAIAAQVAAEVERGPLLPLVRTDAELMPIHRETEPWLPATEEVAHRHGFDPTGWTRADDGSHIVMLASEVVLKFFVPFWERTIDAEEAAMDLVDRQLPVETPRVLARGELDGWEYLAVTRVNGTPLRKVADLSDAEALTLATALGEAIRTIHEIPVPKDSPLRAVVPRWRAFLSDHRKRREELERTRGTDDEWIERLVAHLRPWRYGKRPTNTLLHADLTVDHIMLRRVDGAWRLAALVDFGDAKVGDAAYEFAAPFAFWTADHPERRSAMLAAYGTSSEEFSGRVLESLLLHEFGRLAALDLEGLSSIDDVRRRYVAT